jgi:hypothetical protein
MIGEPETGVVSLRELRDWRDRLAKTDPDDPVTRFDTEGLGPGAARNRMVRGKRWDAGARAGRTVAPAVVAADELLPLNPAEREGSAAVHTEIPKARELVPEPREDEPLSEELDRDGPRANISGKHDRMPVAPQGWPQV